MIDYLLNNAFGTVSPSQVSSKLYYSCIELISFSNSISDRNITSYFDGVASPDSIRFEPFSFPDLVWSTFCQNNNSLYTYPLGDILERSIKQTVASLIRDSSNHTLGRQLDNEQFLQVIYRLADTIDHPTLLRNFLLNFFFDQCMTSLRAKAGSNIDLGYSYQYKNGYLVSLEEQQEFRNKILGKCKEISIALIPHVLSSIRKRTVASSVRTISDGLKNALPFVHWQTDNQRSYESNSPINVVVGTASRSNLSSDYELDTELLRIILKGNHKNVAFDLSKIESFVGHPLNSLTKDLLEIAFIVYISDLYLKRNADYSRNLNIVIPVRHPDVWSQVSKQLTMTISFLARDNVNLNFTSKKERRDNIPSFDVNENKCCCLFSGGVDSAAGVIWALNRELSPILVSYSPGNLSGIQSTLVSQLERATNSHLPHLTISWQASRRKSGSYRLIRHQTDLLYQHLRSFFYLSLAYAIAMESGSKTVYMFENGPVAINPLLSESNINTRTVHPKFLEYFHSLMQSVFNADIDIINPFIYKTKSQLISYIKNQGIANEIIPYTSSCFSYARVKTCAHLLDNYDYKGIHDGDCLPCIIRRVAIVNGGVPAKYDEHLIDVFNIFKPPAFLRLPDRSLNTLVEIADLLRFCQCLLEMSINDLQYYFPDLYIYSPNLDCGKMVKTYQRYAAETINCFRNKSSARLSEVIRTVLAP